MSYQEDIAKLENFVAKLMDVVKKLKREKFELEGVLRQKEEELAASLTQNSSMTEERSEVHQRVSRLIDAIEEWEDDSDVVQEAASEEGSGQMELNLNNG